MIYLDNASTTFPKPESVYVKMDHFARNLGANPSRSAFAMSRQAGDIVNQCRTALARFFNAESADNFVFAFNATDALSMALKGFLRQGDHAVTTGLEHNSISRPLQRMSELKYITLNRISADHNGRISLEQVREALVPGTRLLAITHAANVTGFITPLAEITQAAHAVGAAVLVDAAQTAGVLPIDVRAMGLDLVALPGHKSLLGPMGTGALYVRPGIELSPCREGGTGVDSIAPTQPMEYPTRLEAGTLNALGICGLLEGIRFIEETGMERIKTHECHLADRLEELLTGVEGITLYGGGCADRVGIVALTIRGLSVKDTGSLLDSRYDIGIRAGLHCAPYIHRAMNSFPEGVARFSPGWFNTEAEIERTAEALIEMARTA